MQIWIVSEQDFAEWQGIHSVHLSAAGAEAEVARVKALEEAVEASLPPRARPIGLDLEWADQRYAAYNAAGITPGLSGDLSVLGPFEAKP